MRLSVWQKGRLKASYAELSGDYNPVHMDKEVTGIINESKGIYKFKTYIKNQTGDMVLDTYAIIKYKRKFFNAEH